jgi:hypothetical protein
MNGWMDGWMKPLYTTTTLFHLIFNPNLNPKSHVRESGHFNVDFQMEYGFGKSKFSYNLRVNVLQILFNFHVKKW